jgi:phage/plasmid-like protein (TIGR03299 family)
MNERTIEILDTTGLNWKVKQEGLVTASGVPVDGHTALVREDNNAILSVMSDGYYPYQNHELIELLDKVSNQTGLEVVKGGEFKNGRRVYVQLKSADLRLGNDKIEGYLTGINSFDGSTSLAFGPSNITISCMNTFFAAFKQMETKIRHTKNMVIKVDEFCRSLENILDDEQQMFRNIEKLSESRFTNKIKDEVIRSLFNIKHDVDLKDDEQTSTQLKNKLSRFYIDLNGELQGKGDNLWGLFSGVTKYTTHSLSKGDNTEAKMFDIYGQREKQIFRNLVELV